MRRGYPIHVPAELEATGSGGPLMGRYRWRNPWLCYEVTERFTRVSDMELFYQFTVDDPEHAQTWTGEFSMTRHNGPIYEYACHEGNYSLANILRNGQAEAARRAATPATSQVNGG